METGTGTVDETEGMCKRCCDEISLVNILLTLRSNGTVDMYILDYWMNLISFVNKRNVQSRIPKSMLGDID